MPAAAPKPRSRSIRTAPPGLSCVASCAIWRRCGSAGPKILSLSAAGSGAPGGTISSDMTASVNLTLGTAEAGDFSLVTTSVTFPAGSLDRARQDALTHRFLDEIEALEYQVHTQRAHTTGLQKLTLLPGILWTVATLPAPHICDSQRPVSWEIAD